MIVGGALRPFRLRLRQPLETAAGTVVEREGVVFVVWDEAGRHGFGEAAPLPGHPAFAREDAARCTEVLRAALPGLRGASAAERWRSAAACLPVELPASRFALETALADLAARASGHRLADWLAGRPVHNRVAVNALVGGADAESVSANATAAARAGFETFKLKLAAASPSEDVKRVDALRQAVGPRARIRLDANSGWSPELARDALRELSRFDLEYVEDPVAVRSPADAEMLAALRAESPVPIAADDALCDPSCVDALLEHRAVDCFVLKAAPLGGLQATRTLAERAREHGVDVVLTSTLDAAVGLTASLHLAASLASVAGPGAACGLATAGWLAEDVAASPAVLDGAMALPDGGGLGVDLPEFNDG